MAETNEPKGNWGLHSREEDARHANDALMANNIAMMRAADNLRLKRFPEMSPKEREPIVESFRSLTVGGHLEIFHVLDHGMKRFRYKTETYQAQSERGGTTRQLVMLENLLDSIPESGFDLNQALTSLQIDEIKRVEAAQHIYEFFVPYKATYYGGLDTMALLPNRGGQLYLGDVEMLVNGVESGLLDQEDVPERLNPQHFPAVEVDKRDSEIELWKQAKELLPKTENGETISDRYGRYVADADFVFRAVGEMNTYNSTIKGETIALSETMQQFMGDLFQRRPRTLETGAVETIASPTRIVNVYLDSKGEQIPQDENGNPIRPASETHKQFVDVLDYYNKARSDEEMEYFVCSVAAMAIHNAKGVLDGLPPHINSATRVGENDPEGSEYKKLFKKVQNTALEMMHPKRHRKENLNYKLAKSAVYMADGIAFGTMDVGERGGSYSWEKIKVYDPRDAKLPKDKRRVIGYIWKTEPGQGDPTASGDAFTAAKPLLHEVIYQAIKSRISAFGQGLNIPVNGANDNGVEMAKVFMSNMEQLNQRGRVVEMVSQGKHQYLASYFGMLGAFKEELGHLPAWQEGEAERERLGKKVNENYSRAVEDHIVFIPTPFNFNNDTVKNLPQDNPIREKINSFNVGNEGVFYPMLLVQPGVSLFDMLSVSGSAKDKNPYTVGDMLRKTWRNTGTKEKPMWVETAPNRGGKRITLKDINWNQYPRYAEDGSAVNRKFMLDLVAPLYGAANPKEIDVAKKDPMATITAKIKAADIGYRWLFKKLSRTSENSDTMVKRPTYEAMTVSTIVFNEIALGVEGLVGNGAIERFFNFTEEISAQQLRKGDSHNLYTALRNIEDLLPDKQGYSSYSDTIFISCLAQSKALGAVAIASDMMAHSTTKRFENGKITHSTEWKGLQEKHP